MKSASDAYEFFRNSTRPEISWVESILHDEAARCERAGNEQRAAKLVARASELAFIRSRRPVETFGDRSSFNQGLPGLEKDLPAVLARARHKSRLANAAR